MLNLKKKNLVETSEKFKNVDNAYSGKYKLKLFFLFPFSEYSDNISKSNIYLDQLNKKYIFLIFDLMFKLKIKRHRRNVLIIYGSFIFFLCCSIYIIIKRLFLKRFF